MKFYQHKETKEIVASYGNNVCSSRDYVELVANSTNAAVEKHIPVYDVVGNVVNIAVGEVSHPMTEPHYIQWICLETKNSTQIKTLAYTDEPKASFSMVDGDEVVMVYAYCNLHGLWSKGN